MQPGRNTSASEPATFSGADWSLGILMSIGDGVIATDVQRVVTFANPAAETLTGWSAADAVGRPLDEVLSIVRKGTREPAECPVASALRGGDGAASLDDLLLIARDGEERPVEISATPIRDGSGECNGCAVIFRDIGERRSRSHYERRADLTAEFERRTNQLRDMQDRFQLLVEGCSEYAIYMLDPQGIVQTWNPGAQRISQFTAEEIVGSNFSRFYTPEDALDSKPMRALKIAADEGFYEEDGWRVRKDGTRFWATVVITALRNEDGSLRGFGKVTRDITDRKLAEEHAQRLVLEREGRLAAERLRRETERQRERLRVTLASIGDAVITTDAEGRIGMLNSVAERLTGWSSDEAEGRMLDEVFRIINETTRVTVESPVQKVLLHGNIVGLANHTVLISRDGSQVPIDDSAAPIRDDSGEICGVVLVFRDVTARRESERALIQSEARKTTILNSSLDAIITFDNLGKIVEFNSAAERIFGVPAQAALGENFMNLLVPGLELDPAHRDLHHFLMTRDSRLLGRRIETVARRADHTTFPVELTMTATALEDPPCVTAAIRDITDRKHAEAALRASEHRFRILATHAPVGIFQTNREGECLFVNEAWCQMTGLRPDEAWGRGWVRGLHPEDLERVMTEWYESARDNSTFSSEYRFRTPQGKVTWVQGRAISLFDDEGGITGYLGTVVDVTERLLSAERLRDSEERFRQLAENINEVFWVSDLEKKEISYVSPAYEPIWGQTCESLYNDPKSFLKPIHTDDREWVLRQSLEIQAKGLPTDVEYRLTRPDGTIRWIRDRSFPVRDRDGNVYRMVGFAEDITDRKHSEHTIRALLRISERLNSSFDLDALLDNLAREAVQLVGADSGLAGLWTPEGMVCHRYFHQGVVVPLEYCWPRMHGLPGWLIEHRVPYITNDAANDRQIVAEMARQYGVSSALAAPVLNAKREILGFIEVHNKKGGFTELDVQRVNAVSHIASIAIENARLYQSARESEKLKDEFLAMLAHELRNPLAPIRSGLELLGMEGGADPEVVGLIQEQVQHVVRLVDDLLDVSRIVRGKIELRKEPVEISMIVDRSLEVIEAQIDSQQHEIRVSMPDEPVWLNADPVRLAQVIENLLGNAVKYTLQGRIDLEIVREGDELVITVRDSGMGIEPEFVGRVFDLFAQSTRSLDRAQGGLGIGLTLVRRLVEMHDGTVSAHSQGLGHGSTFTVRLPITEPRKLPGVAESTLPDTGSRRVLVVDDNIGAAKMLAALISRLGDHKVETAHDGPTALEKIDGLKPDIVLLDIGLPGMDGYRVARAIRERAECRRTLLVALTGYGQEEDRRKSRDAGFDVHLVKPAPFDQILDLFSRAAADGN
jgi:PAS domain S-box-containing protein